MILVESQKIQRSRKQMLKTAQHFLFLKSSIIQVIGKAMTALHPSPDGGPPTWLTRIQGVNLSSPPPPRAGGGEGVLWPQRTQESAQRRGGEQDVRDTGWAPGTPWAKEKWKACVTVGAEKGLSCLAEGLDGGTGAIGAQKGVMIAEEMGCLEELPKLWPRRASPARGTGSNPWWGKIPARHTK